MSTVCVPFFFLIGSLNTTQGMRFWRSKWHQLLAWMFGIKNRKEQREIEQENKRSRPGTYNLPYKINYHLKIAVSGDTNIN